MLKIATIVGARPQIIKAAAISRVIREIYAGTIKEIILHSGQHYDQNMSQVFFDELGIPAPTYRMELETGSHGKQSGQMLQKIEKILIEENPGAVVVYGDTNTTLAGALAASKLRIPVVHVESGLRSFNKSMPEEINRILCDHVSTLLFSPTRTGYENLLREGFRENNKPPFTIDNPRIYHCGDVMFDNALFFANLADKKSNILESLDIKGKPFVLCTIHRDSNTDVAERLQSVFSALMETGNRYQIPVIIPLHPRTSKQIKSSLPVEFLSSLKKNNLLSIIDPVSYLDMILLEKNAKLILTDSGGVQKESFFFKKPCIVLRSESEWIELIQNHTAVLADADQNRIMKAVGEFIDNPPSSFPPIFGDGKAAEFICGELFKELQVRVI